MILEWNFPLKHRKVRYMGNMGNPLLNRWGINVFWQHFWYADKYYSKQVQQDILFLKLINTYLYFGLETSKPFFFNNYWYSNLPEIKNQWKYFRFARHKHNLTNTVSTYRVRVGVSDVIPMKIWLLRYNKWLIINAYWFQPIKSKKGSVATFKKHPLDSYSFHQTQSIKNFKRLKALYTYSYFNKWSKKELFF